jgi:hypothetical protein
MPLSIFGYKKELRKLANQLGTSIDKNWIIKKIYNGHRLIVLPTPRVIGSTARFAWSGQSTTQTFIYLELLKSLNFSGSVTFFKKAGRRGIKTGNPEFDEKFCIETQANKEKVLRVFDPNIQFKMMSLKVKKSLLSNVCILLESDARKEAKLIEKHYDWKLKPNLLKTGISFNLCTAENFYSIIDLMVDIAGKIEGLS